MSDPTPKLDKATFIDWQPGDDDAPRKHPPRLHHKKSRAGCQQCRARRVKCNEAHPICGNCERHQTLCIWGRNKTEETPSETQPTARKSLDVRPKMTPIPAQEFPESRDRRLTELNLLLQYQTSTSHTFNGSHSRQPHWSGSIPRLAMKHDSLLYAIYALTALHLTYEEPQEVKHIENSQKYLKLSLDLHRENVANITKKNADAAMITSTFLRLYSFGPLQERQLDPYLPPLEWIRLNRGTGRGLIVLAFPFIADDPNSIMRSLMEEVSGLNLARDILRDDDILFKESNRRDVYQLLRRTPVNELIEPWDDDIEEAYTSTISHVGLIMKQFEAGASREKILRSLALFPMLLEPSFYAVVEECQPRALVVMAHYFAMLTAFQDFWWIGQTGPREVRAIHKAVGEEWQDLLEWPLKTIKEKAVLGLE